MTKEHRNVLARVPRGSQEMVAAASEVPWIVEKEVGHDGDD